MEFIVSNEDYITVIDDHTEREILMDELYLLTNSRKLIELLQNNVGEEFILYRTKSKYDSHKRLILTHNTFHKGHYYFNVRDGKRYKCIGYDKISEDAILRSQISGNKKIKHSKNITEWAIIK